MSVYKRFKGEKVNVGDKNYNRAKWYVRGKFKKQPYNESVPLAKTKKDAEDREQEIKSLILKRRLRCFKEKLVVCRLRQQYLYSARQKR